MNERTTPLFSPNHGGPCPVSLEYTRSRDVHETELAFKKCRSRDVWIYIDISLPAPPTLTAFQCMSLLHPPPPLPLAYPTITESKEEDVSGVLNREPGVSPDPHGAPCCCGGGTHVCVCMWFTEHMKL